MDCGFGSSPSLLCLLKQTSAVQEPFSRNGVTRDVHVVVKNAPFNVDIGFAPSVYVEKTNDFRYLALDVTLLYDCDNYKSVYFVNSKPITFKPKISENGETLSLQCRIQALTSQHEGQFFRIYVKAYNPTRPDDAEAFFISSEPIKVVSKPEQLRSKAERGKKVNKKRTMNDVLNDRVQHLEEQQQMHLRLLEALFSQQDDLSKRLDPKLQDLLRGSFISSSSSYGSEDEHGPAGGDEVGNSCSSSSSPAIVGGVSIELPLEEKEDKGKEKDEFEDLFGKFLKAYNNMDPKERPGKVRRVLKSCSAKELSNLPELVDLFAQESCAAHEMGVFIDHSDFYASHANGGGALVSASTPPTELVSGGGGAHSGDCGGSSTSWFADPLDMSKRGLDYLDGYGGSFLA